MIKKGKITALRGGIVNRSYGTQKKATSWYSTIFTNDIWSYLLLISWSPVYNNNIWSYVLWSPYNNSSMFSVKCGEIVRSQKGDVLLCSPSTWWCIRGMLYHVLAELRCILPPPRKKKMQSKGGILVHLPGTHFYLLCGDLVSSNNNDVLCWKKKKRRVGRTCSSWTAGVLPARDDFLIRGSWGPRGHLPRVCFPYTPV